MVSDEDRVAEGITAMVKAVKKLDEGLSVSPGSQEHLALRLGLLMVSTDLAPIWKAPRLTLDAYKSALDAVMSLDSGLVIDPGSVQHKALTWAVLTIVRARGSEAQLRALSRRSDG
jgi:hypothetical protein